MKKVKIYENEGKIRDERESVFPLPPDGVKNRISKQKEGAGI